MYTSLIEQTNVAQRNKPAHIGFGYDGDARSYILYGDCVNCF